MKHLKYKWHEKKYGQVHNDVSKPEETVSDFMGGGMHFIEPSLSINSITGMHHASCMYNLYIWKKKGYAIVQWYKI